MSRATPRQLELVDGKSREELLLATAPHIDPESPAFKESLEKVAKVEIAEAATAVLADNAPVKPGVNPRGLSDANRILASAGLSPRQVFEDFDWKTDPSVVLQNQRCTAVYHNAYDGIVIRQERTWDEDEDPVIVIAAENTVMFMEALAKRARE